jgi:diadenylate cyclase
MVAILLWFSRTYLGESTMTYSIPITFDSLHRSLAIKEADTRDMAITLNGPLSDLKNLRPREIKVTVDLNRAKEGRQIFSIKKGDVVVPNGIKIENLRPDYVVVEIDKLMEKELRTVVKLGDTWEGIYRVVSWSPRSVSVEGPEDVLSDRTSVDTIPVVGDFRKQQEVVDVPLNIKSLAVRRIKPDTVRVVLKRMAK